VVTATTGRGGASVDPTSLGLLISALAELDHGHAGSRVVATTELRPGVHRLLLDGPGPASVIAKRIRSRRAQLERRVTDRWLPAVGLDGFGPPRLTAVAERDGHFVWHLYDDLGPAGLDREDLDEATVHRAMQRLADLHSRFAAHPFLPEVRFAAGDLGAWFYTHSVRDATAAVERLRPPRVPTSAEDETVRDAVLTRLHALRDDEPARVALLERAAGPETMVHGDLTRANVFALAGEQGLEVRLIDWDHVGVAPAAFDLSTHLAYYPPGSRATVRDAYVDAMAERGHPFPDDVDWTALVATFEAGRLANQLIWLATGIFEGNGWTFDGLADWGRALAAVVDPSPEGVRP
jgi:hypothetical protein